MLSLSTLAAFSLLTTLPLTAPVSTTPLSAETAMLSTQEQQPKEQRFICKGCNDNENQALKVLQDRGILDKNALATIMGNIKQESMFIPNICEGGQRTSYENCRRGGYGLIQFTDSARYSGLGNFAKRIGGDPSSLDTQLNYIFEEPEWLRIENKMKAPGKTIDRYMAYAYSWIGWGIHGARTNFAYDYARKLTLQS